MENVKIILMCELYIINRQKNEDAAVKNNHNNTRTHQVNA